MFRPCIDLHEGKVKQIVGGTLSDAPGQLRTNINTDRPASWFAELYRRDNLKGGHVIMLGAGNDHAARSALGEFTGGMQAGDVVGRCRGGVEVVVALLGHFSPIPTTFAGGACSLADLETVSKLGLG